MADSSIGEGEGRGGDGRLTEYERQRLSRIRENRARLKALGLPRLASSLLGSPSPSKRARKRRGRGGGAGEESDEDYRPSDGDRDGGGEGGEQSSSFDEQEEEVEEEQEEKKRSRRKGKKKYSSKAAKAKDKGKRVLDDLIDDDTALKQAIALSLGEQMEGANEVSGFPQISGSVANSGPYTKKDKTNTNESCGRQKTKIVKKSRLQLTEDEVVAYFFSFDEAGKSYITLRDLERMVIAHDFSWTEGEIFNMIRCFDSDGDGKLSLEDFRSIVCRCNMMLEVGQP